MTAGVPLPTVPFVAAAVLLAAAGVAKLARPSDTARALHVGPGVVRAGAAAEIAVAAVAVSTPAPLGGALLAAAYAALATYIALALKRNWALASCGCFGRPDTPPTRTHALLNCGAAASAIWWAVAGPASSTPRQWGRLFVHSPWHGGPLALVTVVVAGVAFLLWSDPIPAARK
jgi:hypothetical protein